MNVMHRQADFWYLAQSRPNQQDRARANLERQGYACFTPSRPVTRRLGVKLIDGLEPLFPGYLFLAIEPSQPWRPVNSTFGVVGLVMRALHQPQLVPVSVMLDLFDRTDNDGILVPPKSLAIGESVRITFGPMVNFVARVERLANPARVGVLLEMMGRAVRAEIAREHLQPLVV